MKSAIAVIHMSDAAHKVLTYDYGEVEDGIKKINYLLKKKDIPIYICELIGDDFQTMKEVYSGVNDYKLIKQQFDDFVKNPFDIDELKSQNIENLILTGFHKTGCVRMIAGHLTKNDILFTISKDLLFGSINHYDKEREKEVYYHYITNGFVFNNYKELF